MVRPYGKPSRSGQSAYVFTTIRNTWERWMNWFPIQQAFRRVVVLRLRHFFREVHRSEWDRRTCRDMWLACLSRVHMHVDFAQQLTIRMEKKRPGSDHHITRRRLAAGDDVSAGWMELKQAASGQEASAGWREKSDMISRATAHLSHQFVPPASASSHSAGLCHRLSHSMLASAQKRHETHYNNILYSRQATCHVSLF